MLSNKEQSRLKRIEGRRGSWVSKLFGKKTQHGA